MKIIQIKDNSLKNDITNNILRSLPNWFGIEKSIVEYVNTMDDKEFFAAYEGDICTGFFSINYLNSDAADLYVLGIKKEYQHKGIGTLLFSTVENHLRSKGYKYITVQTLSSKSTDKYYAKTRNFYHKMGFAEIYENDKIYDENNPFLLMVKYIG
jgi:ribosomal protein S18 acetylase RimI-like enzyme